MHEYRRFVQAELDARGWKPAELARRSGLHRQLVWKILHDKRPALGQMPEESTIKGIARGFGISADRVRVAAARALRGYEDDGRPLTNDLTDVSIDELLSEIRRRFDALQSVSGARTGTVPVVAEDERKYFPTFERERVVDTAPGEAAGENG